MTHPEPRRTGLRYYDLKRNWTKKIVPHLTDPRLNKILVRDFNKFTFGTWAKTFKAGQFPDEFENNDWRCDQRRPYPRYWRYVKHSACHWIANFALRLAQLAVPSRPWRILTSEGHTTVWDGAQTLFDFNFQALRFSAEACFETAYDIELPPGRELKLTFAPHFLTACCRDAPRYQAQFYRPEALDSFARRLHGVLRRLYPAEDINDCLAIEITPGLIGIWSAMADDPEHPYWRLCPPLWGRSSMR
jgi:hypothetical protein